MALFLKQLSTILLFISMIWLAPVGAAGRDFLVDSDWLAAEKEKNNKLVILEVRYHPHRYHTVGHIEGALQVQRFKDLGDNNGKPIMRFPSKAAFEQTLRQWGVHNDSTLVLYDDSSTALAARLYGLLELFGYDMSQVKILDGGTLGWSAFNELTKTATPTPPLGTVTLKEPNPQLMVEWPDVYADVVANRKANIVLIDARPSDMYSGKTIRHAVQGGHIPGAVNIVSLDGVDGASQQWRSAEALAAMYQAIPKDKTIYLYCHDGFRMSLGWLQLKSLGYQDVRFMNGGWPAWDGAMTLPIVQGDQPYDDEYAL